MNKIVIAGRLVRDPELRATNNGTEVCNFTVAVDRRVKKGEEKLADFVECTAWGKSGVFVSTYFKKGEGITLDGRLESRKYVDKDGNNRVAWGVTCDNVEFALGKGSGGGGGSNGTPYAGQSYTELLESDEDLPF